MGQKQAKLKTRLSPKTIHELHKVVAEFTSDEIKTWHDEFQGSLQYGRKELTVHEFKNVYDSVFSGDASDFAEQVFRSFDTNRNGTVDFTEFVVGLCVSGSSDFDTKLKWAFRMYDIDNDGFISRDEMSTILSAVNKMLGPIATGLDVPQVTDEFFSNYDLNCDGKISWEEFRQGANADPLLVRLLECDPSPDDDADGITAEDHAR